jgi:putative transcriptional regulator
MTLALLAGACSLPADEAARPDGAKSSADSLAGQLLVAAPSMPDPRFAETVIFIVRHDENGAMGLVVNRVLGMGSATKILQGAGISTDGVPTDAKFPVHYGGPVSPQSGYVLHSGDYAEKNTVQVTDRVSITTAAEILRAIAKGEGPDRGFLAAGYAGWAPKQLEGELARKDWLVVPSDEQLVFGNQMDTKWRRAMERHGIEL